MSLSSDIYTISTALGDIRDAIIAKGVTPLGGITTYAEAISQIRGDESESGVEPIEVTKYGCTIDNLLGDVDANGVLQAPSDVSGNIVFNGVEDIADYSLYYKFYKSIITSGIEFPNLKHITGSYAASYVCAYSNISSISFPELLDISGNSGLSSFIQFCTNISTISFPKLTTLSGNYALSSFAQSSSISSISLPELTTISGNSALYYFVYGCSYLETITYSKLSSITGSGVFLGCHGASSRLNNIYFPALTTTSFGTNINQFNNMFNTSTASTSGTCTVHFPSNLSSTISGLTGYPTFGGDSSRIVLAFDLTATS